MDSDPLFNREEVSGILKRAAELEHRDRVGEDGIGLTLQELQEISREVGIDPKYVQQALDERENAAPAGTSFLTLLGGPFSHMLTVTADGTLDDDTWEEAVSEIRRIHGGIGKTGRLGHTYEWEQRKQEVGYVQISLSPKGNRTRIRISANYRYHAIIVYMITGIIGIALLGMITGKLDLPLATQLTASAVLAAGLFAGARFYLSRWMTRKRRIYHRLIGRFRELLGAGDGQSGNTTTDIDLPESGRKPEREQERNRTGTSARRNDRLRQGPES